MHLFTAEELIHEWEKDATINKLDADIDLLKIPNLHSKYSSQIIYHGKAQRKKKEEYDILMRDKLEYYSGNFDKKDYDDREWAAFNRKLNTKDQLNAYLAGDKDLIKIREELSQHDDAINFCQMVVKELTSRTYQIRSYLEWAKYKLGS